MFIGRKQELQFLEDKYLTVGGQLVVLYGRRRVGKTFLIDSVFGGRYTFRHAGLSPVW